MGLDILGKKISELDANTKQDINDLLVTVQGGVTKGATHRTVFRQQLYQLSKNVVSIIGSPVEALDDNGNFLTMPVGKTWMIIADHHFKRVGGSSGTGAVGDYGYQRDITTFTADGAGVVTHSAAVLTPWAIAVGSFPGLAFVWDDAGNARPRLRYTGILDMDINYITRIQVLEV